MKGVGMLCKGLPEVLVLLLPLGLPQELRLSLLDQLLQVSPAVLHSLQSEPGVAGGKDR